MEESIQAGRCDNCPVERKCKNLHWPECNMLLLRIRSDKVDYQNKVDSYPPMIWED